MCVLAYYSDVECNSRVRNTGAATNPARNLKLKQKFKNHRIFEMYF